MPFNKELIAAALARVPDPAPPSDSPATLAARLRHTAACDGYASIKVDAQGLDPAAHQPLGSTIYRAIAQHCASQSERLVGLTIEYTDAQGKALRQLQFGHQPGAQPPAQRPAPQSQAPAAPAGHTPIGGLEPPANSALPNIKHIIAVGAGKGGVGKSSVAVNLAVGLARRGLAVGLMDGDIYGPSIPTMLGLHEQEQSVIAGQLQPFYVHGVKAITIGKLVDPDRPLIWRGPMAHGAFKQLVEQTQWGELDYLIIDLPPGTGDVSLTMSQMMQLTGAVVVCTPQRVAQDDAVRAVRMFQQLKIDVLGVVENMSIFIGDDGKEYDIFGKGGAEKMAARLNIPFLGALPITMALRQNSDRGTPTSNFQEGAPLTRALENMVDNIQRQASLAAMRQGQTRPTLKIT